MTTMKNQLSSYLLVVDKSVIVTPLAVAYAGV